jgi:membrane fusion protein, copper/silver efflux system
MKRKYIFPAALAIVLTGILIYLYRTDLGSHKQDTASSPQTIQTTQGATSSQSQQAAPSTPAQPGEQAEEVETPTVEIPPEKQQLIGVRTVAASMKPMRSVIRTVGLIQYDERKLATINTKFEGWIERLYVNITGSSVKKGQPLAEIYSPELFATQQEFLNTLRWTKENRDIKNDGIRSMLSGDADRIVEAARQRLRLWDISEAQIKKIEETGQPIRTLVISSPVNGYVIQKTALQGMRVMPGEKLFDIADLSTVWVISDIYEFQLPLIKVGQRAAITLSYLPNKIFSSTVDFVYPTLTGETRTAKMRFTIPNPGGQLKPQMFTNVEIKVNQGTKFAVPDNAVMDTGTRKVVYVDKGEGIFEPREVETGINADGFTEIVMGLKAGEKVATSATFLIDSEAQLRGVAPLHLHKR